MADPGKTFASYFNTGSFEDRLIATSGGPEMIQLSNGDTAESVKTDPILAYNMNNVAANNLAFNWKYGNNGVRVVLTDLGHHSGTLSGYDVNDDSCHGLGNDFSTGSGNDKSDAWYHDASIIQVNCHGTSCTYQGTDVGYSGVNKIDKLGSYAFYVTDSMANGRCPAVGSEVPLGNFVPSTLPTGSEVALKDIGQDPTQILGLCEGDCDNDSHCAGSLRCYHRNTDADAIPPGCAGQPERSNDYCFDPVPP